MTLTLMEGAVNAVKGYLESNMVAKLDALDIEYDDFALADIQAWYIAELSAIPEQPCILVLGEFSEVVGEGEGTMRVNHQLAIVAIATDQNQEVLRKRLYRYVRACVELLKTARGGDGWRYAITFERLEYSPMMGRGSTFLSDARLIIKALRWEME